MSVKLNLAALAQVLGPAGPVGRCVLDSTIRVENQAKKNCPVDEGRLRASITHTPVLPGPLGPAAFVYSDVEYAGFVHDGTAPHGIDGNPLLAWNGDSGPAFAPHVDHPGTAPQPFLADACDAAL